MESQTVVGYEIDFHYGLTRWLALQAGFSRSDAAEIARLDQAEDVGFITPATAMETMALLFADENASRTVSTEAFSYGRQDEYRS